MMDSKVSSKEKSKSASELKLNSKPFRYDSLNRHVIFFPTPQEYNNNNFSWGSSFRSGVKLQAFANISISQ